ncbi:MAG: RsmB/NOP family class I SAM-dependent RNA methyltransferase, partial [Clostridia bacterium]|nr:RsmB/NOP family class I SAM-dependent RNA methyltransferase [Clostridia bacterium]
MEKISEKLPKAFLEKMKKQLGSNFDAFVSSFDEDAVRGIRVNTKRISVDDFVKNFDEKLEPISYAKDGFVFESDEKIGTSAKHLSGLCYLQEPASMLAVCSSGIENENRPLKVLDLCASPGGKTSQIASRISEDSILFSNEIIKSRADVLFSNVERQGFSNVVVLNEEPKRLLNFEGFFDYVFVDAPCSGEGMFRKNPETISEWSESNVKMCAERQREILEIAERLVAAGGKLVYSTCTYSEEEDEEIVEWFLENFNFKLIDVPTEIQKQTLPSKANVQNAEFARKHFSFAGKGEGQFVAVFENLDETRSNALYSKKHYRAVNQIG